MDYAKLGIAVDPTNAVAGIKTVNASMMSLAKFAKLAAGAVAGIGVAMVKLGNDFKKASNSIMVDTGATGDALKALEKDFSAVLRQVPDDMAKVAKVIGTLNTLTGQTGESLQGLAKNILDVSRMMGEDATANANLFGKALNQWGIEAADSERVLDVLFKTTQDYGIGLGELTGQLNTFGPVMKTAGLTIEETADLMGRFNKAGIDWTRVAPGMNAALRKMAADGEDVNGALERMFAELENATEGTDRLNIATKLLGAEGAQRAKAAVDAGITSFENLGVAVMGTQGQIEALSEPTKTLGDRFAQLGNQIAVELEPAARQMIDWAFKLIDNIDLLAVALGSAGLAYVLAPLPALFGAASLSIFTMNGALFALGATLATVVKFFTGPLGIAILVGSAAAAIYQFFIRSKEAAPAVVNLTKRVKSQVEQVILDKDAWEELNKVIKDPAATKAALNNAKDRILALQSEILAVILNTEAGLEMQKMMADGKPTAAQIQHFNNVELALDDLREKWVRYGGQIGVIDKKLKELEKPTKQAIGDSKALGTAVEGTTTELGEMYGVMLDLNPGIEDMADKIWDLTLKEEYGAITTEEMNKELDKLYDTTTKVAPAIDTAKVAVTEMADEANPYADAWTAAIERVDSAFADMWKGAFDSFKDFASALGNAFKQLLAELAHAAITRPIMVAFGLGSAGGAQAGGGLTSLLGGGQGGGGFLSGLTNMLGGNSLSAGANNIWGSLFGGGSGNMSGFVGPPSPGMSQMFGGTNLGIGISGLLGGLFGSKFGGEYGGIAGGVGGSLGFSLGAAGAIGGPIGMIIGTLIGTALSRIGGDENENSKLKWWTGDMMNKNGSRPWEERSWGDIGFNKAGDPNRFQMNAPLGRLGASGQHIGNENDAQISDADFQEWLSGMQQYFGLVATMDQAIIDTLELSDGKIQEIIAATETMDMTIGEMEAPEMLDGIMARYGIVFDKIGGLADHVFDSFNAAIDDIDPTDLVAATLTVMKTVDKLGGGFDDLGSDMVNMSVAMVKASDGISLIDAVELTAVFVQSIEIMRGLFDDFEESVSDNATTMWGQWGKLTDRTWDLVKAFDASAESTTALVQGLSDQYNATMQMLMAIRQYKSAAADMMGSMKEKIILEVIGLNWNKNGKEMGATKQIDYLQEQYENKMGLLGGITDPERIMSVLGDISGNIDQRWGLLTDQQKIDQKDWYMAQIERAEELAQDRLDLAESIVEARHNRLVGAIEDGFTNLSDVELGPAVEQFGDEVSDFNKGASDILTAGKDMVSAAGQMVSAANAMGKAGLSEAGG